VTSEIIASFDDAVARCLWVDGESLYVGTCHDERDHELLVADRRTGAIAKRHRMPFLVSDVALVGDDCYAALGPGQLAHSDRGLRAKPTITVVDANAPRFAVHGSTLFWGTYWGDICAERRRIAGVKKALCSIAADDVHVYAGYDDGKVRSFTHDGKRARAFSVGRRAARCAANEHAVVTGDATTGAVAVWRKPELAAGLGFTHDPGGTAYGLVGLAIFDRWIISNTFVDLQIHDLAGTLVASWHVPDDDHQIEDVWLDAHGLLVAAGPHVHAISRAALGC
jgi:hypothetical protein